MDKRDRSIREMRQRLKQFYNAYMQSLHALNGAALIDKSLKIAATKIIYKGITNGSFDPRLLESLARHENPLGALQDGWERYHDNTLHPVELTRILEISADSPDVRMMGLPSGILPKAMRTISEWLWLSRTSCTISQFKLVCWAEGQATRQEP